MSIEENVAQIKREIALAKEKSPNSDDVILVVVSKNHSAKELEDVLAAGLDVFGENRVQEFLEKYDALSNKAQWHIIGHLQHNKVKYIVDKVAMIHSLESMSLAEELSKRMQEIDKVMPCLVQVNVADEESKYGLKVEETEEFIRQVSKLKGIKIVGLMNIAPNYEDKEMVRPQFRKMYELFCRLKEEKIENTQMKYLSMGMSGDYKVAVEEGSNMVRIGSAIFK